MRAIALLMVAVFSGYIFLTYSAFAQVPPHVPGSICLTPGAWCWADVSGPPGTACLCGGVAGIYG